MLVWLNHDVGEREGACVGILVDDRYKRKEQSPKNQDPKPTTILGTAFARVRDRLLELAAGQSPTRLGWAGRAGGSSPAHPGSFLKFGGRRYAVIQSHPVDCRDRVYAGRPAVNGALAALPKSCLLPLYGGFHANERSI